MAWEKPRHKDNVSEISGRGNPHFWWHVEKRKTTAGCNKWNIYGKRNNGRHQEKILDSLPTWRGKMSTHE